MEKESGSMNIDTLDLYNTIIQLVAACTIGATAGYLGSLMVIKRMALAGDALSHLALPGVALALSLQWDMSFGALISLMLGALVLWLLERRTQLTLEALTAVLFASVLAVTLLIIPMEKLEIALLGNLGAITLQESLIAGTICVMIYIIMRTIFNALILSSFNKDLALSLHMNVSYNDLWYLLCVATIVALGVKIVGSLLLAAMVAIPAATSRNVTHTLSHYKRVSSLIGFGYCFLGTFIARHFNIAYGPSIILTGTAFFIASLKIAKHHH
jgi:ABC-type Mn2+/Zn2+ transport system permease subunit